MTLDDQPLQLRKGASHEHRRNPLQDAELEVKFQHLAQGVLPEAQCRAACAQLWSLEHAPNLKGLFDNLVVRRGDGQGRER